MSHRLLYPGLVVVLLLLSVQLVFSEWPQTTLKCFSSLTQPDNRLICPAARGEYCVKEVSSLTENLCGKTQYFGDLYQNSQCEFRKCSDKCLAGTESFTFEGISYSRTRYCCKDDYCNSSSTLRASFILIATMICGLAFYLL